MNISKVIEEFGIERVIDWVYKDPKQNLPKAMDWVDKVAEGSFETPRRLVREAMENEDNPYYGFIYDNIMNTDKGVVKTLAVNFFLNSAIYGWKKQDAAREKYGCNVPWAILLDPTSACNLHCTGCWAAEYGNKLNLSLEEIDDIINQGKELGVYMYIYTGGEPMVRKDDIIKICKMHPDCVFLSFTNGTLIDDKFTDEMLEVKNFVPTISLEGNEVATDGRRGDGVYQKATDAIKLLRKKHLVYGISTCYTSQNIDSVISDEFYDSLIDLGAYFIWYFHYMPVGNNAAPELLLSAEQRKEVYYKIKRLRLEKPLFAIDFQNDGPAVGGCIAGGRRYLHINANGDVDPCVFVHYSDSNIREKSLLEVLQSPLFMAYHDNQPFNDNLLKPCPMLENPEMLRKMVKETNAHSTDLESLEPVEHLCGKCDEYARNWDPVGDELWAKELAQKEKRKNAQIN